MSGTETFAAHAEQYDSWFDEHAAVYISELLAIRPFVPLEGHVLEIGVGSGRFAAPLGISVGIDPSAPMLEAAAARGIEAVEGVAERLPFATDSFDFALVVTAICFVDSPAMMLAEARRVLKPGGRLIIGFVDSESEIGREYAARKAESVFYRDATFFSADQVQALLEQAGFTVTAWAQTLSRSLRDTTEIEAVRPGRGECSFVVVTARNDS